MQGTSGQVSLHGEAHPLDTDGFSIFTIGHIYGYSFWQLNMKPITWEKKMSSNIPTREQAFALLREYNQNESLIKHALAVEGVMRYFARKRGEDDEKWGIIGLIHDLDYERFPEEHCRKTEEILEKNSWPPEYIRAVVSHGWGICSDVEPQTELEKVLYAIDELTGLVVTTALVRPSKSVMDLKANSVKKKWKDKRFAAGVDRSIIEKGVEMLGMELTELITDTIMGMREVADEIGLKGEA
jgi:predicted hydrolase (HD superfamily)